MILLLPVKAQQHHAHPPKYNENWSAASHHPDHIVLTPTEDPSTSMSVTWRTDTTIRNGKAEIAIATAAPKFWRYAESYPALTETMDARDVDEAGVVSNYHSLTFKDLLPDTLYAYRVGDGTYWSEWFQFRTASDQGKPFSFLYVGDAQNNILDLWSRLIREGYRKAPDAAFIVHAGDLVNSAHREQDWHEWFKAGGFIHSMVPSIPTPGNHEYQPRNAAEDSTNTRFLSVQWRHQFQLPLNGIPGYEETVYYIDYEDSRIISLNSNHPSQEQRAWLEEILKNNPRKWTIVTFHHPIYSASARRDNALLRNQWKPLFDQYKVDLVLQGHDHSYARGHSRPYGDNVPEGLNARDYTGPVYVVSVSGGKMYDLKPDGWNAFEGIDRDRGAENTQLFQVVSIDGDKLSYESYTATGELYDAFDLIKSTGGEPNLFVERQQEAIPERRHQSTIPYRDSLPEALETKVLEENEGYLLQRVYYFEESGLKGYFVRLKKEDMYLDLRIDVDGNVLERNAWSY
jgi:hypothetical protein